MQIIYNNWHIRFYHKIIYALRYIALMHTFFFKNVILLQVIDTMTFKRYLWKYTILTKYQQFWSQMMPWLKNNFENIFEIFLKCLETLFRYRNQIWKNILKLVPPIIILNNIPNMYYSYVCRWPDRIGLYGILLFNLIICPFVCCDCWESCFVPSERNEFTVEYEKV